jgi:hypothetical protein
MRIKTMLIDLKGAPCVINESDFNPAIHKKWKEGKKIPKAVKKAAPVEAVAVHKGGGKYVVVVDGAQLNKGWLTKAEAKALAAEQ